MFQIYSICLYIHKYNSSRKHQIYSKYIPNFNSRELCVSVSVSLASLIKNITLKQKLDLTVTHLCNKSDLIEEYTDSILESKFKRYSFAKMFNVYSWQLLEKLVIMYLGKEFILFIKILYKT